MIDETNYKAKMFYLSQCLGETRIKDEYGFERCGTHFERYCKEGFDDLRGIAPNTEPQEIVARMQLANYIYAKYKQRKK